MADLPNTQRSSTFSYAEESITRARQRQRILLAGLALMLLPLAFGDPDVLPWLVGVIVVTIVPIAILLPRWMFRHLRHTRLTLAPEGLVRDAGGVRESLTWDSVARVRARYAPAGRLQALEIYSSARSPMVIAGFEHMDEIGRLVEASTAGHATWQHKYAHVDWENPFAFVAVLIAAGAVVGLVVAQGGLRVAQLLNIVLPVWFGLYFLVYAPLSRQNARFRPLELVIGGLALVSVLIRLLIA